MQRVRLPADIELEDRLAFGLTARQLSIVALTGLLAYGLYALAASHFPPPVAAAAAAPVALCGLFLALGRRDGLSGDRLALAARAEALEKVAATMTNPALQRAALGHARFLRELGAGEEVRRREILLVIVTRARERQQAQTALERRAGEAIELLHAAGVELRI